MNLTPHFTLDEATFSSTAVRLGIGNQPTLEVIDNLRQSAEGMENVRQLFNVPVRVNSWYRCPELNKLVGGSANSAHMQGWAVDFTCKPFTVDAIVQAIAVSEIKFDQLIYEGTWVHISFDPRLRRQVMTAHFTASGTTYTMGA